MRRAYSGCRDRPGSFSEARKLNMAIRANGIAFGHPSEAARAVQWHQMARASEAVLMALDRYISAGGGSRVRARSAIRRGIPWRRKFRCRMCGSGASGPRIAKGRSSCASATAGSIWRSGPTGPWTRARGRSSSGTGRMARRRDLRPRPRLSGADCRRQTARLKGFGSFQFLNWNDPIWESRATLRECLRGRGDLMSKVVSCAEAVARIADGAVVTVSSSSALGCPDAVLAAIRDRVRSEGHPRGLPRPTRLPRATYMV